MIWRRWPPSPPTTSATGGSRVVGRVAARRDAVVNAYAGLISRSRTSLALRVSCCHPSFPFPSRPVSRSPSLSVLTSHILIDRDKMRSLLKWASTALLASQAAGLDVNVDDPNSIKEVTSTIAYGMMKYYTGNNTGDVPGNLPDPYYWWEAGAMFMNMIEYWFCKFRSAALRRQSYRK